MMKQILGGTAAAGLAVALLAGPASAACYDTGAGLQCSPEGGPTASSPAFDEGTQTERTQTYNYSGPAYNYPATRSYNYSGSSSYSTINPGYGESESYGGSYGNGLSAEDLNRQELNRFNGGESSSEGTGYPGPYHRGY